ncbi:MAG: hypothetical protein Q8P33_03480 [bacterium]|nr:hypothetical protein [bacterium]
MISQWLQSDKHKEWLALAWLGLLLVPFVALVLWTHPSADDFSYATQVAERGIWGNTLWYFSNWSGRFASNTLTSLTPVTLSLGEGTITIATLIWYRIIALVMVSFFAWSLWFALRSIMQRFAPGPRWLLLALYAGILTALLIMLVSPAELFYWYPAAVAYCLPWSLLFLAVGLSVHYLGEPIARRRRLYISAATAALAVAIGGQEMSLMIVLVSLAALTLYLWRRLRSGRRRVLVAVDTICLAAAAVALSAPGNFARKAIWLERGYGQVDLGERISSWLVDLVSTFGQTVGSTRLLALLLVMAPLLFMVVKRLAPTINPVINPLWTFALLAALWVGASLPGLLASSPELLGAGRTINTYNIVTAILMIMFVTHLLWWLSAKTGPTLAIMITLFGRSLQSRVAGVWLLLLGLFGAWILLSPDTPVSLAWRNTLSGSAAAYDRQLQDRYTAIRSSGQAEVVVPTLTDVPKVIFFDDISTDRLDWRNTSYARFFGKDSIVLEQKDLER